MRHLNIELKARCPYPDKARAFLESQRARFMGVDHQVDTYFCVPHGRLKLREGRLENALIYYDRPDTADMKPSIVQLVQAVPNSGLRELLSNALGVMVTVDKRRGIYFLENVKFHIDDVVGLGHFLEIEAIDKEGSIGEQRLRDQCERYRSLLGIRAEDLISVSYSDMLLTVLKEKNR